MIDLLILRETTNLIFQLELVSHGTISSYNSDAITGSTSQSLYPAHGHRRAPKGEGHIVGEHEPEFLELRKRLSGCNTTKDVLSVRKAAKEALEHARWVAPPQGDPPPFTLHWKRAIVRASEFNSVSELARKEGVSRPTIYKILRDYG